MVDRLLGQAIETAVVDINFDSRSLSKERRTLRSLITGAVGLCRAGWTLGQAVLETGSSVVVAESPKALLMGAVAARRAKVPLIWQVHERITADYFGVVLASAIRVLGWLFCRGYLANSRVTLSSLITWRRRAIIAYPGVESLEVVREEQRPPDQVVVALVGRLTPFKGQDLFLRALAGASPSPSKVYLIGGTFFGEEQFHLELEQLAEELKLPVIFTGHIDDPQRYMAMSDILVHCSVLPEPYGQVVVEGMQAGCAVIAAGPGGPAEIITDGVNGLLFNARDQSQLTAKLQLLINDRRLRQRLSDAGRLRAEDFTIERSAYAVANFLEIIDGRQQAGEERNPSRQHE